MIRLLADWPQTALLTGLATLAFVVSAEEVQRTKPEQTPITHSSTSVTAAAEQAKRWGLTVEDWSRYQRLMDGPRGTWSPNLDPVTALGVHAEGDAERRRYAEILVRLERERTMRELAFEKVVQQVKRDLYPNEPLLDLTRLKDLIQARTREPPYRAGDRLLLFVNLECHACDRLAEHLRSPSLTPGLVEARERPTRLLQPVFLVGADERSLRWLEANRERLKQLRAIGMLVQAETEHELNAVTEMAQGLPLIPASGEAFATELRIRHYPVIITREGIAP